MSAKPGESYRTRIQDISEDAFWGGMRGLPGNVLSEPQRKRRYALLAAHHGRRLADEVDYCRRKARERCNDRDALAAVRKKADLILRHEIQGWHKCVVRFGKTIDFNADFGRSGQYGFHYLGWLSPVVDMYLVTGEAKYRDCLLDIARQYYDQRMRIKWRNARFDPVYYELGSWAKAGVLLPAYLALAAGGALDGRTAEAFLKLFMGFARSLYDLQQPGFRKGNWQAVGADALFRLARVFPEFRESEQWRASAARIQLEHVAKDFFPDGCHSERCFDYGWMTLEGIVSTYATALRLGGLSAPQLHRLQQCVRKALRWYALLVGPTGIMPAYGDGDLCDSAAIFKTAREFFLPDRAGSHRLLGVDRGKSVCLPACGYAAMRDGAGKDAMYANINFGPWGGGHTHDDLLDFNLWSFGQPIIEEVGRFDSYDNPLNSFFRSARAHNQIEIEDRAMDRRNATGQGVSWASNAKWDFFSASHGGYMDADGRPITIRRNIVLLKGVGMVIYDVVSAVEYNFATSFWLHSVRPFSRRRDGSIVTEGWPGCRVVFAQPEEIRRLNTGADITPAEVTVARMWGPRYCLQARKWRAIQDPRPITYAAAIVPFQGEKGDRHAPSRRASQSPLSPVVSLTRDGDVTADDTSGEFILTVGKKRWRICFAPQAGGSGRWTCKVRKSGSR